MQTIHRSFHGFACEQFHISENVIDRYSTLVHQFPHLSRCNWSLSCSTGFPVKSRQSRARYVDVVYRRPRTPAAYKSPLLCVAGIALASETSYLQLFYCSFFCKAYLFRFLSVRNGPVRGCGFAFLTYCIGDAAICYCRFSSITAIPVAVEISEFSSAVIYCRSRVLLVSRLYLNKQSPYLGFGWFECTLCVWWILWFMAACDFSNLLKSPVPFVISFFLLFCCTGNGLVNAELFLWFSTVINRRRSMANWLEKSFHLCCSLEIKLSQSVTFYMYL